MPKFHIDLSDGSPNPNDPIEVEFDDSTFICQDRQPAVAIADYTIIPAKTAATIAFIRRCIRPEDTERFDALLADKDRVVEAEHLDQVMGWLLETYTNRPTVRPSDSSDGSPKSGSSSGDTSTSKVSTPVRLMAEGS